VDENERRSLPRAENDNKNFRRNYEVGGEEVELEGE
jgi:hypothetical protein